MSSVSPVVCDGTHQFGRDALLGCSAHLGNPSLHLCFDVALLSSSEPDPGDTLQDKSSLVHPLFIPSAVRLACRAFQVSATWINTIKSWLSWNLPTLFSNKKQI